MKPSSSCSIPTWASALVVLVLATPLLGCKGSRQRKSESSVTTAAMASNEATKTSVYQLRVGPAVSPTDPKLSDFKDTLSIGYVGMRFETTEQAFSIRQIEVSLFKLTSGGGRQIETKKVSPLGARDNVFHKSWEVTQPGNYEVRVVDPATAQTLASRTFTVGSKR